MTPEWLKEIEARSDDHYSNKICQAMMGCCDSVDDVPKLLSALKLAIEGLEIVKSECQHGNPYAPTPLAHKAREILEKIQRGDL